MIFRQVIHDDLGCASYLVGDAGVAAVVDPKLHVEDYLRLARYMGVAIEHVVETHNHADHVSGHGRLAAATGATIHISRMAEVDYQHEPFDDGFELELGQVVLRAVHTPGHRPEHHSFLVIDRARGDEPWAVLTGDALFVGDTGRPDLAIEPEDGAREIYRSVHERLLDLPDQVELWPGHLGGSLCGGAGNGPQGGLEHRLRARAQRGSGDRRGDLRARRAGRARPPATAVRGDRGAQPRAASFRGHGPRAAHPTPAGGSPRRERAGGRRAHRPPVRRRPRARRGVDHRPARRLRLQARVAGRGGPGGGAGGPRRRRGAERRPNWPPRWGSTRWPATWRAA